MTEPQYPHAQNQPYGQPYGQPYAPTGTEATPPGPPGPPWHQPAPTMKHSWFARHKILTGLGALVLLIIVISVATSGGGSSSSSPDSSGSSAGSDKTAGIGTPVRDGKFEFTVTKIRCGVPSVGPDAVGETAQGQFCLATLKVSNIGDKPQTLDASSLYGYDAQGRKLNADGAAGIYANPGGGGAFLNEINPGNSANAVVVFDIPKDGKLTKLELHDSPFSGGVEVAVS